MLPVGVGMAVRNASAVIEGLFERGGYFKRTPKVGDGKRTLRRIEWRAAVAEAALAIFFLGTIVSFAAAGYWTALPFLTLFATGYTSFAYLNLRELRGRDALRSGLSIAVNNIPKEGKC